jgi:glycosyltransferase involved in cell wall biosynthesis
MACGTPIIAFNRGSVPEIVEDGVTGFVVEDEKEAVAATHRLSRLSRSAIRQRFEERFTARRMAREQAHRAYFPESAGLDLRLLPSPSPYPLRR